MMLVQQIMNAKPPREVLHLPPGATVREAVSLLAEHRIGAVVVSTDGRTLEGIVSERDIVREMARQGPGVLDSAVSTLMTTAIITCEKADSALQVLDRMTTGRFRHMPVVEGGAVVGMISIGDAVKARLDQLAMENTALEGMIKGY